MLGKHRKHFVVDVVGSLWDGPQRSLTPCIYALVWSFPSYARVGLCDQWHMGEVTACHYQDSFYRSVASVLVALLYVLSDRGCRGSQLPSDEDIQETSCHRGEELRSSSNHRSELWSRFSSLCQAWLTSWLVSTTRLSHSQISDS